MRRLIAWNLLFLLLAAAIVVPWLALDDAPSIEPPAEFRRTDLVWVRSLFQKHDPRGQTPDVVQTIRLDEADLNRLLNYAVKLRRVSGVAAELTPGQATLIASIAVPANPFGRYLNVRAEVADVPDGIRIRSLTLGSLPLPSFVADGLARLAHRRLLRDDTYATLAAAFARINFDENQAVLDYRWQPRLLTQLERKSVELLIPPEEQALLLAYAQRLDTMIRRHPYGTKLPLAEVIAPLFADAHATDGDAIAENRAAFTALGAYLTGISVAKLLEGDDRSIRRAPRVLLTLHGRRDFAEHFVISAAITVNGGSRLANAIGLIKEEEDAGKGSGFSFTDLAANRAGVRLGESASGPQAMRLRQKLGASREDAELLPDFSDLPEFMPQAEFDRRFGPVGSPRYRAMIGLIDARLDAHPLANY